MEAKWDFTSQAVLRMSGFPFEIMQKFRFHETYNEIEQLMEQEKHIEESKVQICTTLSNTKLTEREEKLLFKKIQKKVWQGKNVNPKFIDDLRTRQFLKIADEIKKWNTYLICWQKQYQQITEIFDAELLEKRKLLWEVFDDQLFLEAIFLNSPKAYQQIVKYLKKPWEKRQIRTDRIYQKERTLAKYLQRFCSKNETSSFFGPTYFCTYNPEEKTKYSLNSEQPLAEREVFIAYWVVNQIMERMFEDKNLLPYHRIRVHRYAYLNNGKVTRMDSLEEVEVNSIEKTILEMGERKKRIHEVVTEIEDQTPELTPNQILKILFSMIKRSLIQYEFNIPSSLFHPIQVLREKLIEEYPEELVSNYLNWCDQLEDMRLKFRDADLVKRVQLLEKAKELHHTLDLNRDKKGQFYADRHIFWEDAKRNFEFFNIGEEIGDIIHSDLELAITLYAVNSYVNRIINYRCFRRWYKESFPEKQNVHIYEVLQKLVTDNGYLKSDSVDEEFEKMQEKLFEFRNDLVNLIPEDYSFGTTVEIEKEKIMEICDTYLNGSTPALSTVDYLISAESLEEVQKGNLELVVGELHPGMGVVGVYSYFASEKERLVTEIMQLFGKHISEYHLIQGVSRHKNKTSSNTKLPIPDLEITGISAQEDCLQIKDLYLYEDGEILSLTDLQGNRYKILERVKIAVLDLFAMHSFGQKSLLSNRKFSPRVKVGKLILQRNRWQLTKDEIFVNEKTYDHSTVDIFIEAVRAKQSYKMPDYVFFKSESQSKPIMLDFKNYFFIEILYAQSLIDDCFNISEMLPDPDHLWLKDQRGSFTSEIRHTVVGEIEKSDG